MERKDKKERNAKAAEDRHERKTKEIMHKKHRAAYLKTAAARTATREENEKAIERMAKHRQHKARHLKRAAMRLREHKHKVAARYRRVRYLSHKVKSENKFM